MEVCGFDDKCGECVLKRSKYNLWGKFGCTAGNMYLHKTKTRVCLARYPSG